MLTVPQKPPKPFPMLFVAEVPLEALTLVTPLLMEMITYSVKTTVTDTYAAVFQR